MLTLTYHHIASITLVSYYIDHPSKTSTISESYLESF
jgi:hypothetical protein